MTSSAETRERGPTPVAEGPTAKGADTSVALSALILRLQDGDQSALQPLIEQTQDMAFRLAYALTHDRHTAEDVLQDVYFTVFREIRSLRNVSAFRTWFGRIVSNRCRRLLRRSRPESLDALADQGVEPAVAGHEMKVTQESEVRQTLREMSETDRNVLVMREVMQYSYQEIADTLKIQLGTVKSRLSEARRRLLARWKGQNA